ncbi:uncharacterized protein Z518_05321 [Rhinocladiella mackenziei CBS 650.93]|uniref:UBA domain-containing protein n=1 Tax=Rhinocladiella mackenziei CBS 650.93 TaxID=1442369 RepID=A0A0D2H210_9EURO|nr:uncharacterized protein Z518_05321 [Rhinocladiella mackenziei CBS 650.93]KIX04453.1 hypothetical protein Z518_05321 [Rhinocladiella mackenziei CBS 650.93]
MNNRMDDLSNDNEITYCRGALLLQSSKADADSILIPRPNGGFTCRHCYLTINNSETSETTISSKDWSLIVSCHVQACASFRDRRAAFCCYGCFKHGNISTEISAVKMKDHLRTCELIKALNDTHMRGQRRETRQSSDLKFSKTSKAEPWKSPARDLKPMGAPTPGMNASQSSNISPSESRNPFRPTQPVLPIDPRAPATPAQQMQPSTTSTWTPSSPLTSRLKAEAPSQGEKISSASNVQRTKDSTLTNKAGPNTPDVFIIPGGFDAYDSPTSRQEFKRPPFPEISPTIPRASFPDETHAEAIRRKAVNMELPVQAPSVPPSSFPGAPPPDSSPGQPMPRPVQNPIIDPRRAAEAADIRKLELLGIPAHKAKHLLQQANGDVNKAADLSFSGHDTLSSGTQMGSQSMNPVASPMPAGSGPGQSTERRSRRSK